MTALRVLHVSMADVAGGAARAAHRIHYALREIGIGSCMLVVNRSEVSPHVLMPLSKLSQISLRMKQALSGRIAACHITPTNPVLHSLNWFSSGLADWINRSEFDIVNLHWVGGEMLSVEEIGRIAKPLCWTMHDMWPFTGAEHYDDLEHPGRYRGVYAAATRPSNYSGPDLDAWVWRRKQKAWAGRKIHLISPSHWLADCAAHSSLMSHRPCTVIPNCVNTRVFKPIDRRLARGILNLDPDKRYILFGAMSSTTDTRKGFHLLQPALQHLAQQPGVAGTTELLIFGAHAPANPPAFSLPAHYLGSFHDEVSLALLYSAADVFAAPSMQDNLPNTLVESLACGTPCVAFAIGGMTDLLSDPGLGGLAAAYDQQQFSNQLRAVLDAALPRTAISEQAVRMYSGAVAASKYRELYLSLIA